MTRQQAGTPLTADIAQTDLRDVIHAHRPFPWKRALLWGVTLLFFAQILWSLANNRQFEWPVIAQYLFAPSILSGVYVTLWLTAVAMPIGTMIGLLLAIARLSNDRLAQSLAGIYIWFFRGTPLMIQIIFWFSFGLLYPEIIIAIPFGPPLVSWPSNQIITSLTAAIVGLSLNEGAYMAEVIRGGLLAVDKNQAETAEAFGMTRTMTLWRIVIPQAMRAIIPPTGNQLISLLKATSIVSVIAMGELLYSVQTIYNANFKTIPLLMVAIVWYLLITSILYRVQGHIERYYARSERQAVAANKRNTGENANPSPLSQEGER